MVLGESGAGFGGLGREAVDRLGNVAVWVERW